MAKLVHEIWEVTDDHGSLLPALCLAGPDGEQFRTLLRQEHEDARCVHRFEAENHFEAMTIYHRRYGWGPYSTEMARDREPYLEEWAVRQNGDYILYTT